MQLKTKLKITLYGSDTGINFIPSYFCCEPQSSEIINKVVPKPIAIDNKDFVYWNLNWLFLISVLEIRLNNIWKQIVKNIAEDSVQPFLGSMSGFVT